MCKVNRKLQPGLGLKMGRVNEAEMKMMLFLSHNYVNKSGFCRLGWTLASSVFTVYDDTAKGGKKNCFMKVCTELVTVRRESDGRGREE